MSVVLRLDRCRLIGLLPALPRDEVSNRGRVARRETRLLIPELRLIRLHIAPPPPHLSLLYFPPEEPGCRLAGGSRLTFRQGQHHQTSPHLFIPFHSTHSPGPSSHTHSLPRTHSPAALCPSASAPRTGARLRGRRGGLVCGTVLISPRIWRRKPRYLPPQPPSPPAPPKPAHPAPSLHVSGGCFHHAACVARFVKDVAASCLFHGRLPTSPHIFRPLSFPRLFPSLALPFPHLPPLIC